MTIIVSQVIITYGKEKKGRKERQEESIKEKESIVMQKVPAKAGTLF